MRMRHRSIVSIVVALIVLPVLAAGQSPPYPTDAQTGRAIGANEISAQELKKKLDTGEQVLLIDVRDTPLYEKETIPGAVNIPFANLQEALKDIPKDRTLVFT
jgi:hypothetical protein